MKKYIFFFGWFSSSWKGKKKKKFVLGSWATAHLLALGHGIMELYHDTAGMSMQPRTMIRPGLGHDTAEPAPRYGHQRATIRLACARASTSERAHKAWLGGVVIQSIVSWLRGSN